MAKRKSPRDEGDAPRERPRRGPEGNLTEVNLQRRIQEAELHRHLLIETLHAVTGSMLQRVGGASAGGPDLPPGPWHKGGGPGAADEGGLPANVGNPAGKGGPPLLASNLEGKLAEVESHRHLLIQALHGVVTNSIPSRTSATEGASAVA